VSAKKSSPSPFTQRPESPRVDPAFRGIVLSAPARVQAAPGTLVHGVVQVPEKDFDPGAGVLDAVALVVTKPPSDPYAGGGTFRYAWMPFRERVVLADDVQRAGGLVRGWFATALPKDIPRFNGPFYVIASVGPYASDVLTVEVA
jgi:hypothetical protein